MFAVMCVRSWCGGQVEWLGSVGGWAEELTREQLRDELASADAFVLPTRGEGWGLPVAEAMTMGLPTIVTNWSGPAAFATAATAYLLPVSDQLSMPDLTCQPDAAALIALLRAVVIDSGAFDPHDAAQPWSAARHSPVSVRGQAARAHMIQNFSPQAIADQYLARIGHLAAMGD